MSMPRVLSVQALSTDEQPNENGLRHSIDASCARVTFHQGDVTRQKQRRRRQLRPRGARQTARSRRGHACSALLLHAIQKLGAFRAQPLRLCSSSLSPRLLRAEILDAPQQRLRVVEGCSGKVSSC
jgi:hypothetical protein